ncbi:MAG: DinB family protein [Fimbriimonadaceae bacterium]|nr:DinB family protein [Fimbriimonadaceae bacterium]
MNVREFETYGLQTMASIAGLIRRVPADQLGWRPVESVMTLGQLLAHLPAALTEVVDIAVRGTTLTPEQLQQMMQGELPTATVDAALAACDAQARLLSELLAEVGDEDWQTRQVTVPWGAQGSLAYICISGLDHAVGHRYQLFLYLKLLGQTLGTDELFGG